MKATELKEIDYLKSWALATICATVGGSVVGAIVGAIFGGVLGALGMPGAIKAVCSILGFVVSLPISYIFFRIFVSRFIVNKLTAQTSDTVTTV
jgi:hypothetical protein